MTSPEFPTYDRELITNTARDRALRSTSRYRPGTVTLRLPEDWVEASKAACPGAQDELNRAMGERVRRLRQVMVDLPDADGAMVTAAILVAIEELGEKLSRGGVR